jgi:hypothetical protein
LKRTFTTARVSSKEGQDEMMHVLETIAYVMPDVGYCQGMNFIAGTLVSMTCNEEISFWLFLILLINKDTKMLYLPGVPELHLKNF